MKKLSLILVTLVTLSAFTFSTLWNQDKAHSELAFTVKHLGVSTVSGHFNDFDVVLKADKPDFSDAQIELTAKVNSINTRIEARDNHLKSADFFDAAKFPTLNFKSTTVKKGKKNTLVVTGDLTLHGVTKPVVLTLKYNGTTVNPMSNKETVGFDVTGSIKRSDFGIGAGFGEPVISDVVSIFASGEFSK